MYYVCEIDRPFEILAGPFKTEAEAIAAAGAVEIEKPQYQARIEVWTYPDESQPAPVVVLPEPATIPAAVSIALR